MLMKVGTGRTY